MNKHEIAAATPRPLDGALAEALAEAMETMAFISPLPMSSGMELPPRPCRVCISFHGPLKGAMQITTTEAFAALLATNLIGLEPSDPDCGQYAHDALKELANVACGLMLRRLGGAFQLGLPVLEQAGQLTWPSFDANASLVALDVEGQPLVATVLSEARLVA